jgi:hypothetical protein
MQAKVRPRTGLRFLALASAGLFALVASLASPRSARADDGRIHVVMTDGSEVLGELVEKVPGDHLTLQLATGEVRVIPWASIQSMNPVEATPTTGTASGSTGTSGTTTTGTGGSGNLLVPAVPYGFGAGIPFGVAYGLTGDKNSITWPKPDREPSLFQGDHLYLGLAGGIGMPTGYAGAVAVWDPVSFFELEAGVGTGGRFGHAVEGMARLELPLMKFMRMGIGLGYSVNYLSDADRAPDGQYPNAPRTARWFNFEFVDESFAIGKSGFLRLSSGFAFILNKSDYDGMCPKTSSYYASSCEETGTPLPASPKSYASDMHAPFVPYFGLSFLWRLS